MPDDSLSTPAHAPELAAEATPADEPHPETPMTAEHARAILRAGPKLPASQERDPLDSEERDPLARALDLAGDPLQGAPAAEPVTETSQTPEPTLAKTSEPAPEKRLQIDRQRADGTYVHDARERAILQLCAEAGTSWAEAESRLFGSRPTDNESPAEAIAALEAERARLQADRRRAGSTFDHEAQIQLSEKIEALTMQIADARIAEQSASAAQQAQAQAFEAAVDASLERSAALYPESGQPGSPLHRAIVAELDELAGAAMLSKPNWPEIVIERVARRLGFTPSHDQSAPRQRATPAPGAGGVSDAAPSPAHSLRTEIASAKAKNDLPKLCELLRKAERLASPR